jgi:hypothetical protein
MQNTPLSRHHRAWTSPENRQLRELARKQTPIQMIALKLKRTTDAVRAQAAKEGVSLTPMNPQRFNRRVVSRVTG